MFFNTNDFLEELRRGTSVDDIAKALTANLNEAVMQHKAEEAQKQRLIDQARRADEIANSVQEYIRNYHADMGAKAPLNEMTGDLFEAGVQNYLNLYDNYETFAKKCGDAINCIVDYLSPAVASSANDAISQFLKENGLS